MSDFKWHEGNVTAALASNTFSGHVCCLPNTTWNGGEVDLLVVSRCLRIIDVEIKVSRADLKADIKKDKWWRRPYWSWADQRAGVPKPESQRLEWPERVWKHYYAMPAEIWRDDLLDAIPKVSGVLLVSRITQTIYKPFYRVECKRRSRPCREAKQLSIKEVMTVARLTSLRLWSSRECVADTGQDTVTA